jgi:tRNA(fMet)-specific endonuclease VapC
VEVVTRVALDTSAYAKLRAGNLRVLDELAAATIVYLPATVLGELEAGFRLGRRERENRLVLAEFLDEPFVEVIDCTADVAREYGRVLAELRAARTPIPTNDIWIAASALTAGAHLVTFDRDFERIGRLECIVLGFAHA